MLQDINGRVTDSADIGSNYKYKYENAQICVLPWPNGGGGVLELWPGCGQYSAGGGGSHVKVCPTMEDHLHDIISVGPI
jgi:hypothetical protein